MSKEQIKILKHEYWRGASRERQTESNRQNKDGEDRRKRKSQRKDRLSNKKK